MVMQPEVLKIGIIDSGISLDFLQATDINLKAGANFFIDWERKNLNSIFYDAADILHWKNGTTTLDIEDKSGHGTAVSSIIYRNATTPIEFYIAKILDEQQSGSAICLLAALSWLINDVKTNYINLSLGTHNLNFHTQMLALVKQANVQQCKIFSAAGDIPTLPSELAGVTAVGIPGTKPHNPPVKVDTIVSAASITIFQNGAWTEAALSTSFACPLRLAEHCENNAGFSAEAL